MSLASRYTLPSSAASMPAEYPIVMQVTCVASQKFVSSTAIRLGIVSALSSCS